MAVKISVSLPDDVADHVRRNDNASAYLADLVRKDMTGETFSDMLSRHGYPPQPALRDQLRATIATIQDAAARRLATPSQ